MKHINKYMPTMYMKVVGMAVCIVLAYGSIETFIR
jgi:hypothetical protein